jgi:molybdate transport system regulatory protein
MLPNPLGARGTHVARIRIHISLGDGHSIGPGKAQLLEAVGESGSISAAARSMGMAYRHAWELVDDMNKCFRLPVVETTSGGRAGGGATLTPFGEELVRRFRTMEKAACAAMEPNLEALERQVAGARTPPKRSRRPKRRPPREPQRD